MNPICFRQVKKLLSLIVFGLVVFKSTIRLCDYQTTGLSNLKRHALCYLKPYLLIGFSCSLYVLILLSRNLFTNGQRDGIDSYKARYL
jgi:hypothetical protein